MSDSQPQMLVTGASGQLGRLVVDRLLQTTAPAQIAVSVRGTDAADHFSSLGVQPHLADYDQPETLDRASAGVDRLLLISANVVGQRAPQHRNVIEAAKRAGVKLLAYTSILRADTSLRALAEEHRETEAALRASGIPFVLLRNGWYTENFTASISSDLAHGAHLGSAGEGRFATAARADYAEAAAAVLTADEDQSGRIDELAGDDAFTLSEYVAELSRQSGTRVEYRNLPEAEFHAALRGAGLPDGYAAILANADTAASQGALFDDGHQLSTLIGRPTTPLAVTIAAALKS